MMDNATNIRPSRKGAKIFLLSRRVGKTLDTPRSSAILRLIGNTSENVDGSRFFPHTAVKYPGTARRRKQGGHWRIIPFR